MPTKPKKTNNGDELGQRIADVILLIINSLSRTALIIIGIVAGLLVLAAGLIYWFASGNSSTITTKEQVELSPSQIESIRAIGQWEFLSVNDEELVDTVRYGFFGDDELVRIYSGTLRLGIDLSETEEGWISTDADTVRVVLPAIKLLDYNFIDEANARAFYESGKWTQAACRKSAKENAGTLHDSLEHCLGGEKCHGSVPSVAAVDGLSQLHNTLQKRETSLTSQAMGASGRRFTTSLVK